MIVGVDAGATSALAAVDFNGRAVRVESRKNWPAGELLRTAASFSPVIVACDTNPGHHLARELKRTFGARLYTPRKSLSQTEKQRMASAAWPCRNSHERDALAAALKAYHHVENKLRQAAKIAGGDARAVQEKVLRGEKMRHAAAGARKGF